MKPHLIYIPFAYIYSLSLKEGDYLANIYNGFIARFSWNFVEKSYYQLAPNPQIKFLMGNNENLCVFEGQLQEGNANLFNDFKINSCYLNSTDFEDWDLLADCSKLHGIKVLEFEFQNQWLSVPTEKFARIFQNLPSLVLRCRCTEGFHNLVSRDSLLDCLYRLLPNTSIEIHLNVDYQ